MTNPISSVRLLDGVWSASFLWVMGTAPDTCVVEVIILATQVFVTFAFRGGVCLQFTEHLDTNVATTVFAILPTRELTNSPATPPK